MKIKIDAYYDVTCGACCRSWSTDFNANEGRMGCHGDGGTYMARGKTALTKLAYASGWKCRLGKTLCPE